MGLVMGKMYVLYGDGNEKLSWNASVPEGVAIAQARFEQYLKKGYIACRVEKGGNRGALITEFDPKAEEIMLLSMLEGG